MGTREGSDDVYLHAVAAATVYGCEVFAYGVPRDAAAHGAVSVACNLMIGAGLSVNEVAERMGVSPEVVVALAEATEVRQLREVPS